MRLKLSIIIPAYNASLFIIRCLDSIYSLRLPQDDFEVVVIDDCSVDDTYDKVKKYQETVNNLHILRQKANHKQGAARNVGFMSAKGDYICFVDADDVVEPDLYEATNIAIQRNPDILMCEIYQGTNEKYNKISLPCIPTKVINGKCFFEHYFDWLYVAGPVGYLFNRTYLIKNHIWFAEDVFIEDTDWLIQQLYFAENLLYVDKVIYRAIQRENSSFYGRLDGQKLAYRFLEAYRELVFAETIKNDDERMYSWLVENNLYRIKKFIKNLWKISDREYALFYHLIGSNSRTYLLDHFVWPPYYRFALTNHTIYIGILNIFGGMLQLLYSWKYKVTL